jgi:hypothetical protein
MRCTPLTVHFYLKVNMDNVSLYSFVVKVEQTNASTRMLSIHCDMRYSTHDMYHVADYVRNFGQEFDT